MIDTRCGLSCANCGFRESCSCGGCVATDGHPFHGECAIAMCAQSKNLAHCGECDEIPCEKLYAYSYLDPEHGDKPQGARVEACRRAAAESGNHVWENVLLTSGGWYGNPESGVRKNILRRFHKMLGKPAAEAKVLFIPTAAVNPDEVEEDPRFFAGQCFGDLLIAGISPNNIRVYDIDGTLSEAEAMRFDVIYFTGGRTKYLMRRVKETGFDKIIKKMVYANKVYVGVSAGSFIATPNFGEPYDAETAGLCLVNVYLGMHCAEGTPARTDLPLPHIPLTDEQALAVSWKGFISCSASE